MALTPSWSISARRRTWRRMPSIGADGDSTPRAVMCADSASTRDLCGCARIGPNAPLPLSPARSAGAWPPRSSAGSSCATGMRVAETLCGGVRGRSLIRRGPSASSPKRSSARSAAISTLWTGSGPEDPVAAIHAPGISSAHSQRPSNDDSESPTWARSTQVSRAPIATARSRHSHVLWLSSSVGRNIGPVHEFALRGGTLGGLGIRGLCGFRVASVIGSAPIAAKLPKEFSGP